MVTLHRTPALSSSETPNCARYSAGVERQAAAIGEQESFMRPLLGLSNFRISLSVSIVVCLSVHLPCQKMEPSPLSEFSERDQEISVTRKSAGIPKRPNSPPIASDLAIHVNRSKQAHNQLKSDAFGHHRTPLHLSTKQKGKFQCP